MPLVTASRDMIIVAHQDDDLLFMNPDIQDGIDAGRDVTSVYVTAGDAGQDETYWSGRETGIKAAYATMTGVSDWVDETVTFTHDGTTYEINSSYLQSAPQVRLYFLRLPDGGEDGLPRYNFESLAQLNDGRIDEITTVDGSATYTREEVVGLLEGLLERHQPDQIRVQDHESAFSGGEHRDHIHTSIYSEEAIEGYSASQYTVTSYVHYATSDLRANLDAETAAQTLQTFEDYAAFDPFVFESDDELNPLYSAWVLRQYIASEETVAPASTTSITGRYFSEDSNQGIEGVGDVGIAGASVFLYDDSAGAIIATARTDLNGEYQFFDLPVASDYRILFEDPGTLGGAFVSYGFSAADQGTNWQLDSDVTSLTAEGLGATGLISISAGQSVRHVDAAIYNANPSTISGRYFVDGNGDGQRATTDSGVAGAQVSLIDPATLEVLESTTTDAQGIYQFLEVLPGRSYEVQFEAPSDIDGYDNHAFVAANVGGNDTIDSDVTAQRFDGSGFAVVDAFAVGQSAINLDAGIQTSTTATVSGRYFEDTNRNGIEDAGEAAIAGATIALFNTGTFTTVATAQTDANGNYRFDDVTPATAYTLRFAYQDTLPDQYEEHRFTTANIGGNDAIDSDITRLTYSGLGETDAFAVDTGQIITNMDAGLRPPSPASVSGRYFVDQNNNGVNDGELGLANATVTLMRGSEEIAVTSTSSTGDYSFEGLSYGDDYFVIFENAEFVAETPANGFAEAAEYDGFFSQFVSRVTVDLPFGNGATDRFNLVPGQDVTGMNAGVSDFLAPWAEDGMLAG